MKKIDRSCQLTCQNRKECIFEELESAAQEKIMKHSFLSTYKKNQMIFLQNNNPDGLYCVNSGKIKIVATDNNGEESVVRKANSGETFGHRALFSEEAYLGSATALEDSDVVFLEKKLIIETIKKHPSVAFKLLMQFSHIMKSPDTGNASVSNKNTRERLAGLLIILKESHGVRIANHIRLDIQPTCEEMAAMIGTTHEEHTRFFTEFKKKGVIAQDGAIIFILNEKKLNEFANIK